MWNGEEMRKKLELEGEHLNILFSCLNEKKMMNSEIMVLFNLILKPFEFCNETPISNIILNPLQFHPWLSLNGPLHFYVVLHTDP